MTMIVSPARTATGTRGNRVAGADAEADEAGPHWESIAHLSDVLNESRDAEIRHIDVRASEGVGAFVRLERTPDGFQGSALANLHWPRASFDDAEQAARAEAGWTSDGGIPVRSWALRGEDVALIDDVHRALEMLGADPGDGQIHTPGDLFDRLPRCPRAVTTWDWKAEPPFKEFSDAADGVLRLGGTRVVFRDVGTGGDHYTLVVAGHEISQSEADAAWHLYIIESPLQFPTRGMKAE